MQRFSKFSLQTFILFPLWVCLSCNDATQTVDMDEPPPPSEAGSPEVSSPSEGDDENDLEESQTSFCNIFEPSSCGDGHACDYNNASFPNIEHVCREADPNGTYNAVCETSADCAPGFSCFEPNRCLEYCDSNDDCESDLCIGQFIISGFDDTRVKLNVCAVECSPEIKADCRDDLACRITNYEDDVVGKIVTTQCQEAPEAPSGAGERCESARDCQDGFGCFSLDGEFVCKPYCLISDGICPNGDCIRPESGGVTTRLGDEYGLCSENCSPESVASSGCQEGFACRLIRFDNQSSGTLTTTDCVAEFELLAGLNEPCDGPFDCENGLGCFGTDGNFSCMSYCSFPGGVCTTGECIRPNGDGLATTQGDEYGVCVN